MRRKRVWIATFVVLALLALTACTSKPTQQGTAKGEIEIFSWWTGGGEEAGLIALIDLYTKKYPDVKVINAAVAGGAGTNAKAVLASRMTANQPPDTFQVHAGHELLDSWVLAGKMASLNDLYAAEGWNDKFPKKLIEDMSKDGQVYSVAVNIHRSNVLWYNKKVFDQNGLKPPTTFDEFFQVADALKAKGIVPLAQGDKGPWSDVHLFESVLLGEMGVDAYNELFTGKRKWDDPGVRKALETFKRMTAYFNEDHAAREWQEAAQLVAEGKAGMFVMGDWVKGYYTTDLKLVPNQDFGFVPTPNTNGVFIWLSDSFGLPKNVKNEQNVRNFLKVLGSKEGQDAFNLLKGSIPARLDADKSKYDAYGQAAMADWAKDKLAPSIIHGAAASQGFMDKIVDVFSVFTTSGNVDQAIKGLVDAQSELRF